MDDRDERIARARRSRRSLYAGFVALQLVVPASYYVRDERFDERFAWRMFSGIRVSTCRTTVVEERDGSAARLSLSENLHSAWIEHLGRNRRRVIDRFLENRCDHGASRVELTNTCEQPDGSPGGTLVYARDCARRATTYPASGTP